MESRHYVSLKGRFEPVNVVPSGEVKCFVCNKAYPQESIDEHCNTHIQPKFLVPDMTSSQPRKMGVSQNLIDDLNTEDSDINVQSMLPSQLPRSEIERKRAHVQHEDDGIVPTQAMVMSALRIRADDRDLTSNLGGRSRASTGREEIEFLPLEAGIDIPMKHSKVSKKSIQVYKNENRSYETADDNFSRKKTYLASEPVIGDMYQIVEEKDENPEFFAIGSGGKKDYKESNKMRYNWSHAPKHRLALNTKRSHGGKDDTQYSS